MMSERYQRLYTLAKNLYATGSTVIIAAGALLKDTQTGKVLAQLKLKSLSGKSIKAVSVAITPFDTIGNPLGEAVAYQYLDLRVVRPTEFGAKSPIFLPDATTRQFSAAVTAVVFTDNTIWNADGAAWEVLPEAENLRASIGSYELYQQYLIKYGQGCRFVPTLYKDLWYCTCGALNRQEDETCYNCRCACSTLMEIDMAELREECDARLAAEAEKREEAASAAAGGTRRTYPGEKTQKDCDHCNRADGTCHSGCACCDQSRAPDRKI